LNEQERGKALDALKQMARDAQGNPADPSTAAGGNTNNANNAAGNNNNAAGNKNANKNADVKETRTIKGQKEIVIEIAALKGKGYPAPVDLNTGGKSKKPLNLGMAANQTNTSQTDQSNRTAEKKRF
jgi:hypothetical protein